ncbi:hypothetical protein A3J23_01790 [Candidatus Peregrinibacteria bacterium RIFCSPLOWO2_02_FULL_48_14]|nr:MAG: hypothetical protein A2974_03790 [Candidatus Peregrinibacteria bacterium RIFCSPLOWO2_01_FULL_48_20]OGJ45666.1 MAG: hypothetical protein A3J23_01790 [Candidatus Peregrinibacteria bacterium RIFCSPLOWO2_02_FULL_48_14]
MNDPVFLSFAAIILLFFTLLILKHLIGFKICVLCASVSITWLVLLVLYLLGTFHDGALLALLMGASAHGIYTVVEKKTVEKFHIFRLPFFLSLIFFFYIFLVGSTALPSVAVFSVLILLWIVFTILFFYSTSRPEGFAKQERGQRPQPYMSRLKKAASALLECCKNW